MVNNERLPVATWWCSHLGCYSERDSFSLGHDLVKEFFRLHLTQAPRKRIVTDHQESVGDGESDGRSVKSRCAGRCFPSHDWIPSCCPGCYLPTGRTIVSLVGSVDGGTAIWETCFLGLSELNCWTWHPNTMDHPRSLGNTSTLRCETGVLIWQWIYYQWGLSSGIPYTGGLSFKSVACTHIPEWSIGKLLFETCRFSRRNLSRKPSTAATVGTDDWNQRQAMVR